MSETYQKYTNAPIKEAVFDFQVRGGQPFSQNAYQQFLDKRTSYIVSGKLQDVNVSADPVSATKEITGYRCATEDNKQIALFKKHGFSFIRLEPYTGWDKSYEEALRLWQTYCDIRKPQTITRLAVRFINQFQIPDIFTKAKDYFSSYIQYDESMSPNWNQMFHKLLLSHNQGIKSHIIFDAVVNQQIQGVNVLLDVDVFADGLTLSNQDSSMLANVFKALRKIKNDIFERSITDKTREMMR